MRGRHLRAHVRVNVDEPGRHQLSASIDRIGRVRGGDAGLDRGDAAGQDPDVRDAIEPRRRIDHAPVANHQVVAGGT